MVILLRYTLIIILILFIAIKAWRFAKQVIYIIKKEMNREQHSDGVQDRRIASFTPLPFCRFR